MDPQQHQTFGSYLQIHELDSFVGKFVYIWSDSFEANLHEAEQVSTPSTVSPSQLHYTQKPAVGGDKETNIFTLFLHILINSDHLIFITERKQM